MRGGLKVKPRGARWPGADRRGKSQTAALALLIDLVQGRNNQQTAQKRHDDPQPVHPPFAEVRLRQAEMREGKHLFIDVEWRKISRLQIKQPRGQTTELVVAGPLRSRFADAQQPDEGEQQGTERGYCWNLTKDRRHYRRGECRSDCRYRRLFLPGNRLPRKISFS